MGGAFKEMYVAGLFPGQGSEYVGMLTPLKGLRITREVFGIIYELSKRDIMSFALEGPEDRLRESLNAQLAVFGTSVCYWHLFKERFRFYAISGHSLGFYSALYASNSLSLRDCITVIIEAYKAMEEIGDGERWAMAAVIGLRVEDVEKICNRIGDVFVANINSATQVVISGKEGAVKEAIEIAHDSGALNIREMQIPFPLHSPFMKGIEKRLMPIIGDMDVRRPEIPIIDHTRKRFLEKDGVVKVLSSQLSDRVLWKDSVMLFMDNGVKDFIEIGPSDVLSKLVRWIYRDANTMKAEDLFQVV